jgi:threonyl-tRNA synthetase
MWKSFGFEDTLKYYVSTKPEEKAVGEDALWDKATEHPCKKPLTISEGFRVMNLMKAVVRFTVRKLIIKVRDALNREWQMSNYSI